MSTGTIATSKLTDPAVAWERLLQINVGILVVLGTTLLAMGQQNLIYAIIAIIATVTAWILTDVKQRFHLGPDATTLAALVACVVLVIQVIRNVEQSQLLNVANILIYLEVILLFQKKQDRTYWSLMALSLLQVIVAAALNLGLVFGLLLVVYILAAGTALMLFYAVREVRPFVTPETAAPSTASGGPPAAFVGSIIHDEGTQLINRPLLQRLGRMILVTFVATVVVFFAIPRYNNSVWQGAKQEQITTIGFTEEVRLDDIGRILESAEQVMRVEFTDLQGRPYGVDGEPYFRGTVLSDYRLKGLWKQIRHREAVRPLSTQRSFDLASTVLQRITLQPGSHSVLFNVSPCHYVDGTPNDLSLNLFTRQLTLDDDNDDRRGALRYTLGTTAFRNGWQRDLTPAISANTEQQVERDTNSEWASEQRNRYPSVVSLAESVIAEAGLQQASRFERAKALENHFRRTAIYTYSLDVNQQRNRRLDPIEDFVENHHTGHCEYFAGALTLMLRSQGIPARMVVGYRGGDFNAVGNYYIVRQLHAHAWVEAYLPLSEIPMDERDTAESLDYGCWLRLDPTPDTVEVTDDRQGLAIITTVRELVDYCEVLWDDYVLGLNSMRQQQAIYGPIQRSLQMVASTLFGRNAWMERREFAVRLWHRLTASRVLGVPLSLILIMAVAAFLLALLHWRQSLWRLGAKLLPKLRRRASTRPLDRPQMEVYRRLESILRQLDLTRPPSQTPLEFAAAVEQTLIGLSPDKVATHVPQRVTEAYYRFRYGNQPPSPSENQQLLESVQQLERALAVARQTQPNLSRLGNS